MTGQKASAEEIDRLIETGESETIFAKAILEQGRGHVRPSPLRSLPSVISSTVQLCPTHCLNDIPALNRLPPTSRNFDFGSGSAGG